MAFHLNSTPCANSIKGCFSTPVLHSDGALFRLYRSSSSITVFSLIRLVPELSCTRAGSAWLIILVCLSTTQHTTSFVPFSQLGVVSHLGLYLLPVYYHCLRGLLKMVFISAFSALKNYLNQSA